MFPHNHLWAEKMKTTATILFVGAVLLGVASARAFEAHDDGDGAPYVPAESWIGINGGTHFTEWEIRTNTTGGAYSSDFRDGSAAGGDNEGDFTLGAPEGEVVVGRDLVDGGNPVALGNGEFSAYSWFTPGSENVFLGFALYDADHGELLRWGVTEDGVGYSCADGSYQPLDNASFLGFYEYTLRWMADANGLQFTLSGFELGLDGHKIETDWNAMFHVDGNSVGGIAVIARNGSMSFDQLSVTGNPEVPEPGTLGLLAVGLAGLAGGRRRG